MRQTRLSAHSAATISAAMTAAQKIAMTTPATMPKTIFSAMTAITRSPLGVLRAQPELMAMLERAAWETIAVGRAHGIELTDGGRPELIVRVGDRGTWRDRASDLDRGRGLTIARAMMDEIAIAAGSEGTAVTMRLALGDRIGR